MEIIKNNVKELLVKASYTYKEEYFDNEINILFNYWYLFIMKEKEILDLTGVSLETILYSKYYWCTKFKNKFNELFGKDAGIEQQQYNIAEEIEQRIGNIDWNLIQMIEEGELD